MRCVGWSEAFVGGVLSVVLAIPLAMLVGSVFNPYFYDPFAVERPGGVVTFSAEAERMHGFIALSRYLCAFLVSLLAGSCVVGYLVRSYPGTNGALSGLGVMAFWFVVLLVGFVPALLDPISNPGEVYTRADTLQNFLVFGTALCGVTPPAVLAGYLGGRLGGKLHRRAAGTEAGLGHHAR